MIEKKGPNNEYFSISKCIEAKSLKIPIFWTIKFDFFGT
jgi:hypothetical protein